MLVSTREPFELVTTVTCKIKSHQMAVLNDLFFFLITILLPCPLRFAVLSHFRWRNILNLKVNRPDTRQKRNVNISFPYSQLPNRGVFFPRQIGINFRFA